MNNYKNTNLMKEISFYDVLPKYVQLEKNLINSEHD